MSSPTMTARSWPHHRNVCLGAIAAFVLLALTAAPVMAAAPAPGWELNSRSFPTNLAPGGSGVVSVTLYDIGAVPATAGATLTDTLPAGVEGVSGEGWQCSGTSPSVCSREVASLGVGESREEMLTVEVQPDAAQGSVTNRATVTGGGALVAATASNQLQIATGEAPFGLNQADAWASNADGSVDTQAGSHPYEFTFQFSLDANAGDKPVGGNEARSITVNLPPGLIGNPTVLPQCMRAQFDHESCPAPTQVGVLTVNLGGVIFELSLFNIVPPPGAPAQFGFILQGNHVFLDAKVRSGGDYGLSEHVNNIPQRRVISSTATIWGVPSDSSHDPQRCTEGSCGFSSSAARIPFLTLPTSCSGPQSFSASVNSREDESLVSQTSFLSHDENGQPVGYSGCEHLGFGPSISVAPDTSQADTPAGLTVDLKVPQEGLISEEGLSTSNIRDTTVVLPRGLVINPGQAAGLQACQAGEDGVGTEAAPSCPAAAKVGTDEITTPLLRHSLAGNVYVLQSNPPNLRLLVAASGEGVNLKLIGEVHLDEATGQLTSTFRETPELPFTDFKLSFSGGAQAALATPTTCGAYATSSDFTPWSTPFVSDLLGQSSFAIRSGPAGTPCPGSSLPFEPVLTAGSTTDQAGGFTGFSLLLQRADGQQRISSLSFKTPEGLLGMISKVPLCGEPQAAQGTCPAASQIGHTVVAAGPGPYPLVVPEPGQPAAPIYLTGGYKGAPYGLSIAVPVIAGPFNLGTIVVRSSIAVDPHTAQLTITTDPLPSILDGIPTDLRSVNAVVDRPGFMFNPTSCSAMSFGGTATSTEGAQVPIGSRFQVGSCQALKFQPDFQVSTRAKSSRKNGASLEAKIVYPPTPSGANQASSQSNIASVKVDLPKQLPSRLTTLQKACTEAQFDANPAGCPKESVVGHATALTPVLPVALTGPAYFVSRGGEAFPQLILVLQGYGVTVDLVGDTFISKAGITSSTFKQVPDVPISSFDLTLPQGPYSALAANLPATANGSFCGAALKMPTAFTAQNGAVIHQSTAVAVEGCSKSISVTSHSVHGKVLSLSVAVPSAGTLTVGAKGLTKLTKRTQGRETVVLRLLEQQAGRRSAKVQLAFTPATGKRERLIKHLSVRFEQ
jgi:hypothetical protein